jgi:hypothetical protein
LENDGGLPRHFKEETMKSVSTGRAIPVLLIAALALLVPFAGSASAVKKAKKNSVVTKSIKKGAVKASRIASGAVKTGKIADGAVTGAKLANGSVGASALAALEASRVIGEANQPPYENNWVAKTGSFVKAGFYKDAFGIVHLEGGLTNPTESNTVAFTLPAGYRPADGIISGAGAGATGGAGGVALNVAIGADGTVKPACLPFPFNVDCEAFLDGISFRAAG